jgi:hypothetical protein
MTIELSIGSATVMHCGEVQYSGPVVEWNPQKIRFSRSLSSNYSVRQIADAIFLQAKEIGAIMVKQEGRSFTESKIAARLGIHCTEFFAERDTVEWRVREEILRLYRPDTRLILGVGHPKKVHAIFYGSLVEINKTVIVIQADRILHVRSNQIVVYSKPSIVGVKKKKIQYIAS